MKKTALLFLVIIQQPASANIFKANSYQAQHSEPKSVTHGDVDGDGYNDIILTTSQKGQMLLYRNDQNNGFKAQPLSILRNIVQLELADMNGDDKPDLVVLSSDGVPINSSSSLYPLWVTRPSTPNLDTTYLEIFINQGMGEFEMNLPQINFITQGIGLAFRVADFDQNGHLDLISTNDITVAFPPSNNNETFLYQNEGGLQFTSTYLDIKLQRSSKLADYNLDGFLDIWNLSEFPLVYIYEPNQGFLAENKQSVYFDLSIPTDPNYINNSIESYSNVSLGDLDGDGEIDVQVFENNGQFLRFLKEGNQFVRTEPNMELPLPFSPIDQYQVSPQYGGLIDLQGDGKLEAWIASTESANIVLVSDSYKQPEVTVISTDNINKYGNKILIDDFNADGLADVVSIGANGLLLWENKSNGSFLRHQTQDGRWGRKTLLSLGLINDDEHIDMVIAGDDGLVIKSGNGQGAFSGYNQITSQEISEVLPVDLNNDGQQELLGVNLGSVYKWQSAQDHSYEQVLLFESVGDSVKNLQKIDFDQDGLIDLVYMDDNESLLVRKNTSSGFEEAQVIQNYVSDFLAVESAQHEPVLMIYTNTLSGEYNFGSNDNGLKVISFNEGQGFFVSQTIAPAELPVHPDFTKSLYSNYVMQLVDMDLDGDKDVVIRSFRGVDDGQIWLKNIEGVWYGQLLAAGNNRMLRTAKEFADFNKDGYLDVISNTDGFYIIRDPNAEVISGSYISLGSPDGLGEEQKLTFDFGGSVIKTVDVEGDGDMDLLQLIPFGAVATQLNTTNDKNFSGLWFNPDESGHGLQLEQIDLNGLPAVNFSWFAFHNGKPFWLVGLAPLEGNSISIPVSFTSGGDFGQNFNPDSVVTQPWGQVDLILAGNDLSVSWQTTEPGFTNGNMSMQRLAITKATSPVTGVINSCHSGSWYNPAQSGHGFFINVIENQGEEQMTLAWYHYLAGEQQWLVAQGPVQGTLASMSAQSATGAQFPPNFVSSEVEYSDWGQITFTLLSDTEAKISWFGTTADFPAGELLVEKLTQLDRYHCN